MNRYIVMSASAHMPNSCWGRYRRVAVVEIDPARLPEGKSMPAMISNRARGVVRVVRRWERRHCGITERCAFGRAVTEAEELADELNKSSKGK